jgi:protein-L-isoaspartate(D-aspartate) O-methyltransferase
MSDSLDEMVEYDIKHRGVKDERVLDAFRRVDRKLFVPDMDRARAYEDRPLHLGHGQTISQPYVVAAMTEALNLKGTERVLEIGTGSGFQTAILATLAKEVFTVERIERLATTAEDRLLAMKFNNIRFRLGDGSCGWQEHAPYERIIVTAACPELPKPLLDQLGEGGIMVAPVGPPVEQELVIATKRNGQVSTRAGMPCIFVRLIGRDAFPADEGYRDNPNEGRAPGSANRPVPCGGGDAGAKR